MKYNVANFYVLPLIGLNKTSFGEVDNFVNSYITQDGNIVVKVKEEKQVPDSNGSNHAKYLGDTPIGNAHIFVYEQPIEFQEDILLFAQGKYTQMSNAAKDMIKKYSGLPYNLERRDLPRKSNGQWQTETSIYILGLEKDNASLRSKRENELGVKLPMGTELISKPDVENFFILNV